MHATIASIATMLIVAAPDESDALLPAIEAHLAAAEAPMNHGLHEAAHATLVDISILREEIPKAALREAEEQIQSRLQVRSCSESLQALPSFENAKASAAFDLALRAWSHADAFSRADTKHLQCSKCGGHSASYPISLAIPEVTSSRDSAQIAFAHRGLPSCAAGKSDGGHPLLIGLVLSPDTCFCDICNRGLSQGQMVWYCEQCDFDVCSVCMGYGDSGDLDVQSADSTRYGSVRLAAQQAREAEGILCSMAPPSLLHDSACFHQCTLHMSDEWVAKRFPDLKEVETGLAYHSPSKKHMQREICASFESPGGSVRYESVTVPYTCLREHTR